MPAHDPGVARLLASAPFQRARRASEALADDGPALLRLVAEVEQKHFGIGPLDDRTGRIDVDIACSVVEARAEELETDRATVLPVAELAPAMSARLRLVIAALLYLVTEDDVIPDSRPDGHIDDVAIIRWATKVARGDLPVSP